MRASLKEVLTIINGSKGHPHSFDALEKVLDDQAYRLSFWRVASDEINYRRFFDINDLAAIRVESPEVFGIVHRIPFELIRKSLVSGIRIDHPDGLFDPLRYFEDLQAQAPLPGQRSAAGTGHGVQRRLYLAAEKILVGDEELRPGWAIEGTTGYGFLNLLNGLFVDASKATFFPAPVPQVYRVVAELSRPDLREQAAGHAGFDVQRAQRAFAPSGPYFRAASPLPRLHSGEFARRLAGSDRLFPRVPHLYSQRHRSIPTSRTSVTSAVPSKPPSAATRRPADQFSISSRTCCCSKIRTASVTPTALSAACS